MAKMFLDSRLCGDDVDGGIVGFRGYTDKTAVMAMKGGCCYEQP
ncbi:MAG: hypothetical protein NTU41_07725 [Chloroflexi bacterium]|nr:hypothetical protein [Chloroflexota bacterium]